jgi:hypothetical protein
VGDPVGRDGADDLRHPRRVVDPRRVGGDAGHDGVLAAGPDEGVDLVAPGDAEGGQVPPGEAGGARDEHAHGGGG